MKYVNLSFDDGRSDTYDIAFPILKKYGLYATVNIISNFVLESEKYQFKSATKAMTIEQILNWQQNGYEVACHGKTHSNTVEDVVQNIRELKQFGVNTTEIGFASPSSEITPENVKRMGILSLKERGILSYIRSGVQIRRGGVQCIILSIIEKITHSSYLYWILNRNNVVRYGQKPSVWPSVAVKSYTSLRQLTNLINKIRDNEIVIIMFHSILRKDNKLYGADDYYWDAERFEKFCEFISKNQELKVVTMREIVKCFQ